MKILTGSILTLFLGLMFVSLFQASGPMSMTHGMIGMSGMGNCPSMSDQEVLCTMSLNDHVGVWKVIFFDLIPAAFTLFLSLGVAVLILSTTPHLLTKPILHRVPIRWQQLQHKTYTYSVRPYQELFSNGILHPKLF